MVVSVEESRGTGEEARMLNVLIGLPPVPEEAEGLVAWASWYRSELRAPGRFLFLHVVPVPGQDVAGMMGESVARAAQEGEALLARLRAEAGPDLAFAMASGDPGAVLVREAAAFDLLVVATHHRAQLSELLLGSTGAFISHHAPCAVMLLGPKALERFRRASP
jgi:nucleotide-binding universal stress UspA family protein